MNQEYMQLHFMLWNRGFMIPMLLKSWIATELNILQCATIIKYAGISSIKGAILLSMISVSIFA